MSKTQINYYTVPLSSSVSEAIAIKGSNKVGLIVSIPTSCTAFLAVSHNSTDFFRGVFNFTNPSTFDTWNVGSGGSAKDLSQELGAFPYFRLETSVPMSSVASLVVVTKF